MGSSSKIKGSNFERELCKFLSDLFQGSFVRSNNSGAMIGGKNKFRKANMSPNQLVNAIGDIVPPDHMRSLVIEAKFYKDFKFHQLLTNSCPQLEIWIKQCLEVIEENNFWIIIFKINQRGIYVAIPELFCKNFIFDSYVNYNGLNGKFNITEMNNFFIKNKNEIIKLSS